MTGLYESFLELHKIFLRMQNQLILTSQRHELFPNLKPNFAAQ